MSQTFGRSRPSVLDDGGDPYVIVRDLPHFGIRYSAVHLRRLWTGGTFPAPEKLGPRMLGWRRSVIQQWIAQRTGKAA